MFFLEEVFGSLSKNYLEPDGLYLVLINLVKFIIQDLNQKAKKNHDYWTC